MDSLLFEGAPPGIKFALGENVRQTNRSCSPASRAGSRARAWAWRTCSATRSRARRSTSASGSVRRRSQGGDDKAAPRARRSIPPRRDLELDALVEVLEGKRLVHCHSYRADEILMMLRVAKEFGFRVATSSTCSRATRSPTSWRRPGSGASTFADMWGYKLEAWDAIPHNAALMAERGVIVTINSDSDERARRLYQEAAKAMRYGGASEEEALRMITLNAAKQLGIDKRVGSIEVGKDADIAIFNGHPFAPASRVEMTLIDGRVFFDRATSPTLEQLDRTDAEPVRPRVTSEEQ